MWNLVQLPVRKLLLCATIVRALTVGFTWFCGNNGCNAIPTVKMMPQKLCVEKGTQVNMADLS